MKLLEFSVFNVCGKECTLQFEPAADMSWQSWACNELNQAATYPLPICKRAQSQYDHHGRQHWLWE